MSVTAARLVEVTFVAFRLETVVLPKLVIPDIYRLVEVTFVAMVLTKTVLSAATLVDVTFVNIAVEAPVVPIGVLLIVPPSMVRPFTTMASVILLFGNDKEPDTVRLATLAFEILELVIVVVAKELVPVKVLLPTKVASVEVSARLLNERPIIFEPVKFTVPF